MSHFRTILTPMVLAVTLGLGQPALAQGPGPADRRTLTVVAEGVATSAPDVAQISVGVVAQATDASDALDQMGKSVEGVLASLIQLGVEGRDIQTDQLYLEQQFDYSRDGNPQAIGFAATSNLSVTIRDLATLGTLLDQVVDGGANRLNGISFGFADPQDVLDDARSAAISEARRRAEVYATAAGVDLGALLQVTEIQSYGGPVVAVEAAARDVPVATGSVSLTASVQVTFEITE